MFYVIYTFLSPIVQMADGEVEEEDWVRINKQSGHKQQTAHVILLKPM
jgi:hypothetical protein